MSSNNANKRQKRKKRKWIIPATIFFLLAVLLFFPFNCHKLEQQHPVATQCDSIEVVAGAQYKASKVHRFFFGDQYRAEWTTVVKIPCFSFQTDSFSYTIEKAGGGKQTRSLRLVRNDGVEFILRSVNKDPTSVLHPIFRRTLIDGALQDLTSTHHPYGALVIPVLAEAIGVYHTRPAIMYIPYTTALGEYVEEFAGMVALFEVRPDDNLSGFHRFGNSANVRSTEQMYASLRSSNNVTVDQEMFAKARLLDMLVNDWDRHEDQWRWAVMDTTYGTIFQPIPRDRDQVFMKAEGIIPDILNSNWALRKMKHFDDDINDVIGLNINARYLDKNFLNKLTHADWQRLSIAVSTAITDDVIDRAVGSMPAPVVAISGEEIKAKLQKRRGQLAEAAMEYYAHLSNSVDIRGSDEQEIFTIKQQDSLLLVEVYAAEDDMMRLIYKRSFSDEETEEITLHPLAGNDRIILHEFSSQIEIKIFSGDGPIALEGNDATLEKIERREERSPFFTRKVHNED